MAWPQFRGHHDRPQGEAGKNGVHETEARPIFKVYQQCFFLVEKNTTPAPIEVPIPMRRAPVTEPRVPPKKKSSSPAAKPDETERRKTPRNDVVRELRFGNLFIRVMHLQTTTNREVYPPSLRDSNKAGYDLQRCRRAAAAGTRSKRRFVAVEKRASTRKTPPQRCA